METPEEYAIRYVNNTINSRNLFARYAQRSRFARMIRYLIPRLEMGKILDYGCGRSGILIKKLKQIMPIGGKVIGYDPRPIDNDLQIYSDYNDILKNAPYHTITICEVMEHLQWTEITKILTRFEEILHPDGVVIVSVPIEVGPAVFLKILKRINNKYDNCKYNILELIGTAIFGITAYRDKPDASVMPHKGFDFRHLIRFIKSKNWQVKILSYSPLPLIHWYGNSQIFFQMTKIK